jgi:hypothetical protein
MVLVPCENDGGLLWKNIAIPSKNLIFTLEVTSTQWTYLLDGCFHQNQIQTVAEACSGQYCYPHPCCVSLTIRGASATMA